MVIMQKESGFSNAVQQVHTFPLSFHLPLILSLSLSVARSLSHTNSLSLSHTHTQSLSFALALTHLEFRVPEPLLQISPYCNMIYIRGCNKSTLDAAQPFIRMCA